MLSLTSPIQFKFGKNYSKHKTMTRQDIHRAIASIEGAIRQTYADRHRVNRRYFRTALTDIRDYIRTLRTFRKALSLYQ